jgi:acyl dehydratase
VTKAGVKYTTVAGPFFDDISVGDGFDGAPGVTLTDGLVASHRAIVGGRLHLASNVELSRQVAGKVVAPPTLVWDVAIGQSTLVTGQAIANLFYRGLVLRAHPAIGDTLKTRTEIVGVRVLAAKPGRAPRGLVVMHIVTTDQTGAIVLDFYRCAMLPARSELPQSEVGNLEPQSSSPGQEAFEKAIESWNLASFREAVPGPHFDAVRPGAIYRVETGDVVSSAPELARLTMNLAAVHHDSSASANGERLVYGGHTIGLAAAQISRALPGLVTILGWQTCDHIGPVHEGDTLYSEISVERCEKISAGGLVHLRSFVRARRHGAVALADVLDWRLIGLMA